MARGARRSRRRFGAALAPFVLGDAALRERRGDLYALEQFDAVADFTAVAADVAKMAHAGYLTELVRDLSPERASDPVVFDLYAEALALLAGRPARAALLRAFELKLLGALGLQPSLSRCAGCGAAEVGGAFDPGRGGMLCAACAPGALQVGRPALDLLLDMERLSLADASERPLAGEANAQARAALIGFIEHHLGRALRSPAFIAEFSRR